MTVNGYLSQWLNLLERVVIPTNIMNQTVEIHKYFRHHHISGTLLRDMIVSVC